MKRESGRRGTRSATNGLESTSLESHSLPSETNTCYYRKLLGGSEVERIERKHVRAKEEREQKEIKRRQREVNKERKRQNTNTKQRERREAQANKLRFQLEAKVAEDALIAAEDQQRRLLADPRRANLEAIWNAAPQGSELERLAKLARRVLEGAPATCRGYEKTYTLVDIKGFMELMQSDPDHGIIVIRDPSWHQYRVGTTSDTFIADLDDRIKVDVQDLGRDGIVNPVTMSAAEVKRRWIDDANPMPINLLNISCENIDVTPPPILARYDFMSRASAGVEFEDRKAALGKQSKETVKIVRELKSIGGKDVVGATFTADLKSCQRFQICGRAGAISGWHLDSSAPYTWVTLEGNRAGEVDEDVLKYWAVVDFGGLSQAQSAFHKSKFAREGPMWEVPVNLIRVISLVKGDTLVMPPGTIHAPITVTNCLFRGGMCWSHTTFVRRTLVELEFISRHKNHVTNEEPAEQTAAILKWAESQITAQPSKFRVAQEDLPLVKDTCQRIIDLLTECNCKGACSDAKKARCPCYKRHLRCTNSCKCKCTSKDVTA